MMPFAPEIRIRCASLLFRIVLLSLLLVPASPLNATVLRVVGDSDYPPLVFLDKDGRPSGYDVDVLNLAAQAGGLSVSLDLMHWSRARELFDAGSADVLLGINVTPERQQRYDFTEPHFENHLVIFTPQHSHIEDMEDLFGRRIGVAQNTTAEEYMRQRYPELQLWTFPSQPEAMKALEEKRIDGVVGSAATGIWTLRQLRAASIIHITGTPLWRNPYAMALHKNNPEILAGFNRGILELKRTGELQNLRNIWFEHSGIPSLFSSPMMLWGFAGVVALLALSLGIGAFMSHQIRSKTQAERELNARLLEEAAERKEMARQLRDNEVFLSSVVENIPSGIFVKDLSSNTYILSNKAAEKTFGFLRKQILRRTPAQVFGPEWEGLFQEQDAETLSKSGPVSFEDFQLATAHAELRWFSAVKIPLALQGNTPSHILEIIDDITESKEMQDKLRWTSFHDGLTGLYNRSYFEEEMKRLGSGRNDPLGIIICDLDGMKLINDTLGHAAGDRALKAVARILQHRFRQEDMVARIGGDEFAVLLPQVTRELLEEKKAEILQDLEMQNQQGKNPFALFLSLGFALRTSREITMEELFHRADEDMYREKLAHRPLRKDLLIASMLAHNGGDEQAPREE